MHFQICLEPFAAFKYNQWFVFLYDLGESSLCWLKVKSDVLVCEVQSACFDFNKSTLDEPTGPVCP